MLPLRDKLTSLTAVSFRQASGIHLHSKKGRYRESQRVLAGTNRSGLHGFQPGATETAGISSQSEKRRRLRFSAAGHPVTTFVDPVDKSPSLDEFRDSLNRRQNGV